ncbi:MAG: hypothetical protein KJ737_07130 [Proteobacteria bacterium]|nr:hypothetical protein [Pseudomonadota bacterium]
MKKFNENLFSHLTPKQRICLAFEAQARGDEAEYSRLTDTCPRKTYSGPDLMFRGSWDAITGFSLATECDLRGYALSWLMAIRAGETETAHDILGKMESVNKAWIDMLKEAGLSDKAIKAARPASHFVVETLLSMVPEGGDPDADTAKVFDKIREEIPIILKKGM